MKICFLFITIYKHREQERRDPNHGVPVDILLLTLLSQMDYYSFLIHL